MTEKILVDFQGPGSGTDELTWGQRTVWRVVAKTGRSEIMGGIIELPPGTTVDQSVAVLRFVMGRHQSLRTRLRFDAEDGGPRQYAVSEGTIELELVDAAGEDPAAVARRLRQEYEAKDFEYEHEWPIRMGVVLEDGVPTHTVAVYNHLAIDAHGMDALVADLANLDFETGEATAPMEALQPLELARRQRTPNVRRNGEAALRYWERVLRTISPSRVDGAGDETRSPRWGEVRLVSPAAQLATRAIAGRIGTDTSPVLLAGYAAALARTIGNNPVALQMAVSNRFRSSLVGSVCTMAQTCPLMVDVAGITFEEAVNRARQAAMVTYKYAYYDPEMRAAMVESVKEDLGFAVELDCYFNDRRPPGREERFDELPTAAEITAARARTEHSWPSWTDEDHPLLYLNVDATEDDELVLSLRGDVHRVSSDELLGVLTEYEEVLVAAALDPGAGTGVPA